MDARMKMEATTKYTNEAWFTRIPPIYANWKKSIRENLRNWRKDLFVFVLIRVHSWLKASRILPDRDSSHPLASREP